MSKAMEDRIMDEKVRIAARMLQRGKDTIEEIAEITDITVDEVKEVKEQQKSVAS